jgi:hypothetical protein
MTGYQIDLLTFSLVYFLKYSAVWTILTQNRIVEGNDLIVASEGRGFYTALPELFKTHLASLIYKNMQWYRDIFR